jgi:hypothetical protein
MKLPIRRQRFQRRRLLFALGVTVPANWRVRLSLVAKQGANAVLPELATRGVTRVARTPAGLPSGLSGQLLLPLKVCDHGDQRGDLPCLVILPGFALIPDRLDSPGIASAWPVAVTVTRGCLASALFALHESPSLCANRASPK